MKTFLLPDDFLTTPVSEEEVIIRLYKSDHNSLKNKIILNRNMINIIISGTKTVLSPQTSAEILEGEMVIISTGNLITSEVMKGNQNFTSLIIYFSNEILTRMLLKYSPIRDSKVKNENTFLVYKQDKIIKNYRESLLLLLETNSDLSPQIKQLKLEEIFLYLLEHDNEKPHSLQINNLQKEHLRIKTVMERHIGQTVTIDELAFLCNMSSSTFKRKFEQLYDLSPKKWLLNKKMELAAQLLSSPESIPSQIYEKVGYQSHSSFTDAFKHHFDMTPSEYQIRNS